MKEYKIGKAIVRIHGNPDPDRLKAATTKFLKQVESQKKKKQKTNQKSNT